uniref:Uncharacterized protein n=1 Tax=Anguilla anguilla TaxID=7936 RepID=A0A0E9QZ80_ANGAN
MFLVTSHEIHKKTRNYSLRWFPSLSFLYKLITLG